MGVASWSAEPTYTVPFTIVGDDETIGSFWIRNWVIGKRLDRPHPAVA
jgi:hypothetical protein